ncbi:uncharacterized protein At5g01610 [Physcomitrium patens]|uniref:DUF538 family protein n=1 Tax=Physcomitrium patens TaxID=3218 RepID=A9SZ96_PHYPA|nr:uncharacterized protein At5g01610-like [Physcomitrium patens]PNR46667.1 hypothetical protein PHYPA_013787 [Physcomitrium patens]|eukprot:XP_024387346.1 uncharacterized protein At5g01610-like [Physcomitrella patens]
MDSILSKAGGFLFAQKASNFSDSLVNDANAFSSSISEGTSRFISRLQGKVQTPLPELLQKHQIPEGLFPKNVLKYEFDETTGQLAVVLPFPCEVRFKDDSVVRYDQRVTGVLSTGVLKNIEGMKTKILMMWSKVVSVTMDKPEATKVVFISSINKSRPRDAYILLRDGIEVDDF